MEPTNAATISATPPKRSDSDGWWGVDGFHDGTAEGSTG
jgi:hypothetical protein